MALFQPDNSTASADHARLYAIYEIWYTTIDFAAAFLFIVGSIFFFWDSTQFAATWMFLVGSVFFAMKPTLRLVRELHYLRLGKYDKVTKQDG
ncbi:MAG: YrhK family protein [Hyphomicrobiales bacterium]|nr:YrhK family protein [Hyphomicrobiales bacterium]